LTKFNGIYDYETFDSVDPAGLSEAMQGYLKRKKDKASVILFLRVGDFYEAYFQDAKTVAEHLELVLTAMKLAPDKGRIPLAGVPYHAIERYVATLNFKGFEVDLIE